MSSGPAPNGAACSRWEEDSSAGSGIESVASGGDGSSTEGFSGTPTTSACSAASCSRAGASRLADGVSRPEELWPLHWRESCGGTGGDEDSGSWIAGMAGASGGSAGNAGPAAATGASPGTGRMRSASASRRRRSISRSSSSRCFSSGSRPSPALPARHSAVFSPSCFDAGADEDPSAKSRSKPDEPDEDRSIFHVTLCLLEQLPSPSASPKDCRAARMGVFGVPPIMKSLLPLPLRDRQPAGDTGPSVAGAGT
mmetsp:Transcript_131525/g.380452  ORF Transcript_131525/g.380452 Transcript_131525/m.380452 type:complete len:254 (-) Transcript_131525:1435-2196(-)